MRYQNPQICGIHFSGLVGESCVDGINDNGKCSQDKVAMCNIFFKEREVLKETWMRRVGGITWTVR